MTDPLTAYEEEARSSASRIAGALNVALLLGLTAFGVWSWPALPARIPAHFGFAGRPDRWTAKGDSFWLLLALPWILSTVFWILRVFLLPWLALHPQWVNLPRKEEFLRLPPERQRPVWRLLDEMFAVFPVPMTLLFATIQVASYEVALGRWAGLPTGLLFAEIGLFGVFVVVYVVRSTTCVRRLVEGANGPTPSRR